MIPDISISFKTDNRNKPYTIVLDAKYRVELALNEAISSAHMYRDAIVVENGDTIDKQVEQQKSNYLDILNLLLNQLTLFILFTPFSWNNYYC